MADGPTRDSKKVGFSGISGSGRIAGPSVHNRKWTTLKVSLYIMNDSLQQLIHKPSYANNDDKQVPQLVSSADPCKRRDRSARWEGIRPHSQLKHTFLSNLKEFCLHCGTTCLVYGQFRSRKGAKTEAEYNSHLTLILPRSRTGTVWFYTSTSNKRAARPKLYTKSLTRDLKRMYSRLTQVRISINL